MRKVTTPKLLMATILAVFPYATEMRVLAKLTHVGANGEEIDQLQDCKLAKPMTISFRIKDETDRNGCLLAASDFFARVKQRYQGLLKANEEVDFTVGGTIYLTAADVHDWDGQTLFRGHAVHRLAGFVQDSVSGHVKSRKVTFEYAQPKKRRTRGQAVEHGAADAAKAALQKERVTPDRVHIYRKPTAPVFADRAVSTAPSDVVIEQGMPCPNVEVISDAQLQDSLDTAIEQHTEVPSLFETMANWLVDTDDTTQLTTEVPA